MVTKISSEITWTKARAVPIIAYRDWLSKPTTVKNMFPNKIKIKWYKTIESTFSNKNIEGPQIKFWENISWQQYKSVRKTGAKAEVGRGIKKISFVKSLNKSRAIWKAPLRPINVGPIRRIA